MTSRPVAVLPVYTRWSNGWALKASASSTSPVTTPISSGSRCSANSCATNSAVRGTTSDGLRMARLPAASTEAKGLNRVNKGAFQVPRMPTVPLGWCITHALAPS
ncbi:hypothetical protein D9M71_788830 [compost metagenome]